MIDEDVDIEHSQTWLGGVNFGASALETSLHIFASFQFC